MKAHAAQVLGPLEINEAIGVALDRFGPTGTQQNNRGSYLFGTIRIQRNSRTIVVGPPELETIQVYEFVLCLGAVSGLY